jgi:prepilin-type N-terminal cleavage/methylation domain-containing protein
MSRNNQPPNTQRLPRPTASWRCRLAGGFTLVELLIVVALMGIIAAVVIPRLDAGTAGQLEAAGSILVSDLDYARQLAVVNQSSYTVDFAASGTQYTITHSGANSAFDTLPASPFRRPGDPADEHICRFADLPQSGLRLEFVALQPAAANPTLHQIEFEALGSLSSGSDSTIWLAAGIGPERLFLPVTINAATGLARVGAMTSANPVNSASAEAVSQP